MDGSNIELLPFLPYILQDIWEIGSDSNVFVELIRKHMMNYSNLKILDLGCGKGAVSIKLAKEFNCLCLGIDAVKEFIKDADNKAKEYSVSHLCRFEVGDIRLKVKELHEFDIIILGSIGPVFGDYYTTLNILTKCLNKNGIIIIDDGFIENNSNYFHSLIQKQDVVLQQIMNSGMQIMDEVIMNKDSIKDSDDHIFEKLKKRCNELIEKHPTQKNLFENYIRRQKEENYVLENKIVCSTIVLRRK